MVLKTKKQHVDIHSCKIMGNSGERAPNKFIEFKISEFRS